MTQNAKIGVAALVLLGSLVSAYWMYGTGDAPPATHARADDDHDSLEPLVELEGQGTASSAAADARVALADEPAGAGETELGAGVAGAPSLEAGASVTGRVVADRTGHPVEGAIVGTTRGAQRVQLHRIAQGDALGSIHAVTDERGEFVLSGLTEDEQRLVASHADYALGTLVARPNAGTPVEIRLSEGLAIFGAARGDDGQPLAGVLVRGFPEGCFMGRVAFTDIDGTYRLLPMPTGMVELVATPPAGQTEAAYGFTSEWQRVELEGADLRVDFGPRDVHATWRGTLYDYDGSAQPGGRVGVVPADTPTADRVGTRRQRWTRCDERGVFELKKLVPGTAYRVQLELAERSVKLRWDDLTIGQPGLFERDVRVRSTVLAGIVVDGATGGPPESNGNVHAWSSTWPRVHYSSGVDDEGRFCLRDLQPGVYELHAGFAERPTRMMLGVAIEQHEVRDDLVIEIGGGGELRIIARGFDAARVKMLNMLLTHAAGDEQEYRKQLDEEGGAQLELTLAPGVWKAHLAFVGFGTYEAEVNLLEGESIELFVGPSDVVPFDGGTVTVEGRLQRADGSPVADAFVHFFGYDADDLELEQRGRGGQTDAEGRFSIDGLRAGRWWVSARTADGGEPKFPDLIVPPDPPQPLRHDLVLPGGTIRGELRDAHTGALLKEDGPLWWVFVHDAESGRMVAELQGGHRGPTFTVMGVAAGQYELKIVVRGYRDHILPIFALADGETLSVGTIELVPGGVLELEVVDASGDAIDTFEVSVDGATSQHYPWPGGEAGVRRLESLALGERTVVVRASGYVPRELRVGLLPNEPHRARVVLERE